MKRIWIFVAFVFALSAPVMAAPQTVGDYIKLAQQDEDNMDYFGAIDIYDAIIKQYPTQFPGVYADRAEVFSTLYTSTPYGKGAKEAIRDYGKALALDPPPPKGPYLDHAKIYEERGKLKYYIGDDKGAVADLSKALAKNPKDSFLLSKRAGAKLDLGDCSGAVSDYTSALTFADKPEILDYDGRAEARICAGDMEGAFEDYRSALGAENYPHSIDDESLNKWAVLVRLGSKDHADSQLAAELTSYGKDVNIEGGIDQQYDAARYFLGQIDEAALLSDAKEMDASQKKPSDTFVCSAYYYGGLKRMALGRKDEAIDTFRKVLKCQDPFEGLREQAHVWIRELSRK